MRTKLLTILLALGCVMALAVAPPPVPKKKKPQQAVSASASKPKPKPQPAAKPKPRAKPVAKHKPYYSTYAPSKRTDAAVEAGLCPDTHHPHAIDMGDAGIWACCNVGSLLPTDHGGYFAWGDTEEKTAYHNRSYKYWHKKFGNDNEYEYYNLGDISGNKQYDVASAKWDGIWKIPTSNHCKLLLECSNEWTTINGVNGRLFTASNGNCIFLPAAGYRKEIFRNNDGRAGSFWTSTPGSLGGDVAFSLDFDSERVLCDSSLRVHGRSVRPIAQNIKEVQPQPQIQLCPDDNHPHAIDMGEAGVWACCNVGASQPTDFGNYYAWGETKTKSYYSEDNYAYKDVDLGSDISGTQYDAARVNWGGRWKMPTFDRCNLLLACSNERTTINGVNGQLFIATNGNRLFLPASGCRDGSDLGNVGFGGYFWSSTPGQSGSYGAYYLYFGSNGAGWNCYGRGNGRSVRPVTQSDQEIQSKSDSHTQQQHLTQDTLCPDDNHPHAIDMGDAGVWACCNVGASKPTDYGNYYAWGEKNTKNKYSLDNYVHDIVQLGNSISGTRYDAASANWGEHWKIPTLDRCKLLLACSNKWTTINGVKGQLFIATNGNRIFLPAAGSHRDSDLYGVSSYGNYWTYTCDFSVSNGSYYLSFDGDVAGWDSGYRGYGRSVRPVVE